MSEDKDHHNLSSIHNGASCKSYCWSQNHSDLEICVKLSKVVKYENVDVTITSNGIKVELIDKAASFRDHNEFSTQCLIDGKFERSVCSESAFWVLDNEGPSIVIYVDKSESMWWKQLLIDEEVTLTGPRNYSVPMDRLDDESRMVVDRLIVEQKNKMYSTSIEDSLSPA